MKTRRMAMLLALVMLVGLFAGCGQSKQNETTAPAQTEAPAQTAATEAPKAAEAPKATEAPAPTAEPEPETHMFTDIVGREVEIPTHPQRIALPATVLANMVYALQGHVDNVVSITPNAYSGWEISTLRYLAPELETVDTTMCSDDFTVNVEALAEANVDLVINWDTQEDQAKQLDALGIPCVLLKQASNLEALEQLISMLGEVLNCPERTEEVLQWYTGTEAYFADKAGQINALKDEEKPRVLVFQRVEKMQVYGKGMAPYITTLEGGTPYTAPADGSSPTMEDIIAFDPEIIFLSNFDNITPEDLYENRIAGQEWSAVSAVKNHRVYKVPSGLYRWAPPNTFEKPFYMRWTASIVQPEIFSDIDVRSELKTFYKDFYGYELSEAQLDEIFRTELNKNSQ